MSRGTAPARTPKVVLLVDDEVLIRLVIAEYLRQCGYRVIEADSADEAVTVLRHRDIPVDVVLSDVDLRGAMDGFSFANWVRENQPGIVVLLASSITKVANAAGDLCEEGPQLKKPYEPHQVVEQIRRLIGPKDGTKKQPPRGVAPKTDPRTSQSG